MLRIVLAVLLRGGAIEVTHQGRKHRNHNDPACRIPFTAKNAFRAASFTPREGIGLKKLTQAARNYEEITGSEVDIEESALAQAFQKLVAEDRERLLPVVASMEAYDLPGLEAMIEHQEAINGILEMAADDCVTTLAGEGKSYQQARSAAMRLADALTGESLQLNRRARRSEAVRRLQKLATPEQRVVTVRVAEILGSVLRDVHPKDLEKTEKAVDEALGNLKEHLLKLIAEGVRIVLE